MATNKQKKFVEIVTVTSYQKRKKPRKHYVFQMQVLWSDDTEYYIYRRYSELYSFQTTLVKLFPEEARRQQNGERVLPVLPGRIFLGRSHVARVAEARVDQINKYCQALLKLPSQISESQHILTFFTALPGDVLLPARNWKKQASLHPLKVPTGGALAEYSVVKDFKGENSEQLTIAEGDTVQVVHRHESGWWMVLSKGKQGWVPESYLRPTSQMESPDDDDDDDGIGLSIPGGKVIESEEYRAIDDYNADDDSQVSFKEGDVITVIDKEDDGWWFVAVNGHEGWAPFSYLEPIKGAISDSGVSGDGSDEEDTLRHMDSRTPSKYGKLPMYMTTANYRADEDDEISIPKGVDVQVVKKSITGWWTVKYKGKVGLFPASFLVEEGAKSTISRGSLKGQRKLVPRKKTIINRRTMRFKTQQVQQQVHQQPRAPHQPQQQPQLPILPKRYLRSKNLSANSSSSGEENDTGIDIARSKSPALPPRPRQTVINRALSPSKSLNIESPRLSRAESEASVEIHISDSASGSPSPPYHQKAKGIDEGAIIDSLLKIILESKSVEMKAQLADVLIAYPSVAERVKRMKEQ